MRLSAEFGYDELPEEIRAQITKIIETEASVIAHESLEGYVDKALSDFYHGIMERVVREAARRVEEQIVEKFQHKLVVAATKVLQPEILRLRQRIDEEARRHGK